LSRSTSPAQDVLRVPFLEIPSWPEGQGLVLRLLGTE
jgi:hypothetical protein